ncbi:MAG: hypothetical protein AAFW88_10250 [Pseudomonadota bacterium]
MKNAHIQIELRGSEAIVGIVPPGQREPLATFNLEAVDLLTAIVRAFEIKPTFTACGQIDVVSNGADPGGVMANRGTPIAAVGVDELAIALSQAILAAPDEDDEAALSSALERLKGAQTTVEDTLRQLRQG